MRSSRKNRESLGLVALTFLLVATAALAESARARELYVAGKRAFGDEQYAVAEGDFRQLLKNFPASSYAPEATLLLGESLFYQERWAEAATLLEDGRKSAPQKLADAFVFWLGESYARQNRLTDALPLYREVVDKFPASKYWGQAQFSLGDALFRDQQFDPAKAAFQSLLRHAPNEEALATAAIGLGKVHLAQGLIPAAEENFRTVIVKHSKTRALGLAHYWLAECRRRLRDFDGARKELKVITDALQKVHPRALRAEAWFALGRVHLEQNDFIAAAQDFSQAKTLTRSPELHIASVLQQAEALFRAGQIESSIEQLRTAEPTSAPVLFRIAELLYWQRKFELALAAYREVVGKFSQSEEIGTAHFGAAWSLLELGRASESVDEFGLAAQLGPSTELKAQAQMKIGDIFLGQKQYARAVESYQAVLDKFSPSSVSDRAQFQMGFTHAEAGQFSEAAAAWEALVNKFPGSGYADRAQFQAGVARYNLSQFPESRRAYELLLNNFKESALRPKAWLAIARVAQAEGRFSDALTQYNDFPQHFPNHELQAQAVFEHADCVAKLGDPPRARAEFAKFLATYPTHPLAANAQFWLAHDLYVQKEFLKAREAFAQLTQKFPDHDLAPEGLYWAGRATMNYQSWQQARDLFEELVKKYPRSRLCAEARYFQGDSLTEEGKFGEAIRLFEELVHSYPQSLLAEAAWGRKGNCLYELKRFEEAVVAYEKVVISEKASLALRNEAEFGIGRCLEQLGKPDDAFKRYASIVYRTVASSDERESLWFSKAAIEAARIRESQKLWADAVRVLEQLAKANVPASAQAQQQAEKIRKEHPEEF